LSHGNALIQLRKYFPHTIKDRSPDPSKIWALEFKLQFRRFEVSSISATIDDDRSIFTSSIPQRISHQQRNTVSD